MGSAEKRAFGERLERVRVAIGIPQREMAVQLGVKLRAYTNYAAGVSSPDADALPYVVQQGWNANWLLTGEGPERLEELAAAPSQNLSPADLSMAMKLADEKIAASRKDPSRDQYAAFVASIYDALVQGLPEAEVLDFSTGRRIRPNEEKQGDGGRQGVGEADQRPAAGNAGKTGSDDRQG